MFKLTILTLGFCLLASFNWQIVYSSSLDCGDKTPEACKTLFGKELEERFKKIFFKFQYDVFNELLTSYKEVETELPADDTNKKALKEFITKSENDFKEIQDNEEDNSKIRAVADYITNHIENPEELSETVKDLVKNKANERNVEKKMTELRRQELIDIDELWKELYDGLRPEDKKEYPVYEEINEDQLNFQEGDLDALHKLLEILGNDFGLSFFKALDEFRGKDK